ncbi:hypothetical protein Rhe02_60980 [Rhizocola hellebori]|uniref:Uncharacterized protein n=1 Tax=Rhizocola hellebori TaxID=1392758 RepID=A0A8J3QEW6_9ACTN|nr:hypothetical protein Rhe02_60980 [Rhizocola hellebori]
MDASAPRRHRLPQARTWERFHRALTRFNRAETGFVYAAPTALSRPFVPFLFSTPPRRGPSPQAPARHKAPCMVPPAAPPPPPPTHPLTHPRPLQPTAPSPPIPPAACCCLLLPAAAACRCCLLLPAAAACRCCLLLLPAAAAASAAPAAASAQPLLSASARCFRGTYISALGW